MLTNRSENGPARASASASVAPSFTRSRTLPITLLRRACSTCSVSAPSDSTSGMPAPSSVASWRVAMARSLPGTERRKLKEKRELLSSAGVGAEPVLSTSSVR